MIAVLAGLMLATATPVGQDDENVAPEDPRELREEIDRQQGELDDLRRRLEAVEGGGASGGPSPLDLIRINVYSNITAQTDDKLVFDEDGREIQDRIRVRKTDFDFRAPLGRGVDAVVVATLEADPVSDYDAGIEMAFARVRFFEDEDWETHLLAGQFRSRFGRNNRLRMFEMPQPTRPLVVSEFLGQDGYLATGGSIMIDVPVGSERHDLVFTFEGTNSGDLRLVDDAGDEPVAGMLNLDWSWDPNSVLNVSTGLSGYFSRGGDDLLGGADLMFSWFRDGAEARAYTLGAEVMTADPETGDDALGYYVFAEGQLAQDWYAGVRYDYTERLSNPDLDVDQAGLYASWFFTDHLRITVGYEHSRGDESNVDGANHLYLEGNVFLGPDPLIPGWSGRRR